MKKAFLFLFVAGALSLSACGKKAEEAPKTPEPAAAAAADTTAAPAAAADTTHAPAEAAPADHSKPAH